MKEETMTNTTIHEPPTREQLADAAKSIRHWTVTYRPGGLPIRWRNLSVEEQHRLVALTDERRRDEEWRQLVVKAAGRA